VWRGLEGMLNGQTTKGDSVASWKGAGVTVNRSEAKDSVGTG
jgi:hypothetical protein